MSLKNIPRSALKPLLPLLRLGRREALALAYKLASHKAPQVLNRPIDFELSAPFGSSFLVGTLSGLLLFHEGKLYRLFDGRVYGISRHGERWYVYRNQEPPFGKGWGPEKGQILSFRLDGPRAQDLRVEAGLLDPEVHQIDFFKGRLFVTDTANNCLIVYRVSPGGLESPTYHYPNGELPEDGSKSNYVHINSVFSDGDNLYLVYHNQTYKTGNMSEVVQLDSGYKVVKRWSTLGKSAHNIYVDDTGYLICNSQDGELHFKDETLLKIPYYTRGLALNNERILLGASEFANKAQRMNKDGHVFALERENFQTLAQLSIPGSGSIYELRFVDQPDFGLSQTAASLAGHRLPLQPA